MSRDSEWDAYEDGYFHAEFYVRAYGFKKAEQFIIAKDPNKSFVRGFNSYLVEYKERNF